MRIVCLRNTGQTSAVTATYARSRQSRRLTGPLMSFAEVSPAKTSATPANALGLKASEAVYGPSSHGSFAFFDLDSLSWRTWQRCLDGDLEEFSETWPRAGMTRNGIAFPQVPLAPLTGGIGSGLWATPVAQPANGTPEDFLRRKRESVARGNTMGICLSDLNMQVQAAERGMWPTPSANKITQSGEIVNADGTPWDGAGKPHSKKSGKPIQTALTDAVKMWPTPHGFSKDGKSNGPSGNELGRAVNNSLFATPTSRDWKSGKASQATHDKNSRPLSEQIGGSLNPTWVEWLMGYPLDWSSLEGD